MEGEIPPDDSIPVLVSRLIDDSKQFLRAEIRLYRARLFTRLPSARNAVILLVGAVLLIQAVLVAALVGLLMVLRQALGPAWATAIVVVVGFLLAGIMAWSAAIQLHKATQIKEKGDHR